MLLLIDSFAVKDEPTQAGKDDSKKQSSAGSEDVLNIPTIQIDTPSNYNSNQPLPTSLMDTIKNRLPTSDEV